MRDAKHYAERVISLTKEGSYSLAFGETFQLLRMAYANGVLASFKYDPESYGFEVRFAGEIVKHCVREPEVIADIVLRRLP